MIEARQKTITVYVVNGEEFEKREDAVEGELRRALGGYLKGTKATIPISDLVRALSEPAVKHAIRELLDAPNGEKIRGL